MRRNKANCPRCGHTIFEPVQGVVSVQVDRGDHEELFDLDVDDLNEFGSESCEDDSELKRKLEEETARVADPEDPTQGVKVTRSPKGLEDLDPGDVFVNTAGDRYVKQEGGSFEEVESE